MQPTSESKLLWDMAAARRVFLSAFREKNTEAERFGRIAASMIVPPSEASAMRYFGRMLAAKETAVHTCDLAPRELAGCRTLPTLTDARKGRQLLKVRFRNGSTERSIPVLCCAVLCCVSHAVCAPPRVFGRWRATC